MCKRIFIVVFSLISTVNFSYSQIGKICNWQDDKKAAVVLTFDDWTPGHFYIVYPELQARNINATFFVTTNGVSNWSNLKTVVSAGNEVGNHSESHSDMTKLTASQIGDEIRGAKTILDKNITGRITYTYAYPYGTFNAAIIDSLEASGHIASRGVWPISDYSYNFAKTNDDYFNTRIFGIDTSVSISEFYAPIKNVINGGGFLTYLCHMVANASYPDKSSVQQAQLQQELDTLVSVKDKIWITTYGNALKYHREKRCASLSEIQAPNGVQWIVNLTDTLSNNSVYNYPLTVKLKTKSVNYDKIFQNGNPLSIDAIANDTIMFRAIPDGGQIVLMVSTGISITSPKVTPSTVSNNSSNNLSFEVTATDDGSISKVEINLSPIGGNSSVIMTPTTANKYISSFTLPAGTPTGTKTFVVTATDNTGNINTSPIIITVNSGTVFSNSSVSPLSIMNNKADTIHFSLKVTDDGSISSVKIDLSSIGGGAAVSMNNDGNNNYSKDCIIPSGANIGIKNITVTVTDNMGNITSTVIPFTIEPYLTYLNIYTDNDAMICSTCVWAGNGTIKEQSNAGAKEGIKDYFFEYTISSWWASAGFNVSSWSATNAKDFSAYDSLQFSYLGPTGDGSVSLTLSDANKGHSNSIPFPVSTSYKTYSIPLSSIVSVDLSKITEIDFNIGGVDTGKGAIRIDDIRLVKLPKTDSTILELRDLVKKNLTTELSVFPNPNNGTFYLHIEGNIRNVDYIEIFNINGKTVYKSTNILEIAQNKSAQLVSIQASPGIYYVRLVSFEGESIIKKVIIK